MPRFTPIVRAPVISAATMGPARPPVTIVSTAPTTAPTTMMMPVKRSVSASTELL